MLIREKESVMKALVDKNGVLIPKRLLKGITAVEIRKERGHIIVLPLPSADDPVFELGKHPVKSGISDAAKHHDKYLYGGK